MVESAYGGTGNLVWMQVTQRNGRRESAARSYLHPVRSRPNLNNCLVVNGQHGCGEF